jgi:hypothetical protein
MDTETVEKIIEMLEHRLECGDVTIPEDLPTHQYDEVIAYAMGKRDGLTQLKNFLERCIDPQVSQVENDMNRGE